MANSPINKVIVLGGTHGDEMSGVCMVQHWLKNPQNCPSFPSFSVKPILSNPEAIKLVRRYKDCDLNRQATAENLSAKITDDTPYEIKRVQELKELIEGDNNIVIDLHNTTSNMKCTLILEKEDQLTFHLAKYVQDIMGEDCKIAFTASMYCSVRCIGKHGVGIEVGPQPQGVLRADIYDLQKRALMLSMEFLQKYNSGVQFPSTVLTMLEFSFWIKLSHDEDGNVDAAVHPDFQDQDFKPISYDSPIFKKLDGQVLKLSDVALGGRDELQKDETEIFYPIFINEAAYYEKNKAAWVCKKIVRNLNALQVQK